MYNSYVYCYMPSFRRGRVSLIVASERVRVAAKTRFDYGLAPIIKEASRAEELLDDVVRRTRRVFGESHPTTRAAETELEKARGISRMAPRTPAGQVLKETV